MKAVVYDRYGGPEVLRVENVPTPTPAAGQVLVRVVSTSVNLSDWECLRGSPLYARIGGLRTPARRTLGSDIVGRVEALGPDVTRFRIGDDVYGDNLALKGGFAEYAVVPESALASKPAGLTFTDASTIPQAGAIALQGTAGAAPGRRVLINGGGGGSGSFAIQLAKRAGAHVTAVDNAAKLDYMRSLGADHVIDYRSEDFTRSDEPYDLILDLVARRSVFAYRRALNREGRYQCVGGSVSTLLRVATIGLVAGRLTGRRIGVLAVKQGPTCFEPLAEMCVAGEMGIHVDRTFRLDEVAAALAYVGEGRAQATQPRNRTATQARMVRRALDRTPRMGYRRPAASVLKLPADTAVSTMSTADTAAADSCGSRTLSITWITPFDAPMSVFTTFASFTETLPPLTLMVTDCPLTVFAAFSFTTWVAATRLGTTWYVSMPASFALFSGLRSECVRWMRSPFSITVTEGPVGRGAGYADAPEFPLVRVECVGQS